MALSASLIFVGLVVVLMAGLPVAFSLGLLGVAVLFFSGGVNAIGAVATTAWAEMTSFVFIALPLFVFMSTLVSASGMGDDLFDIANKWFGRLPGGLAVGSIAGCAGFGAVCGSSAATAAAIGIIAVPAMKERGYNQRLALGTVAAGGCLGQLIPPSMPMIIYGAITDNSIGQLFMAGALPGVLMAVIFMIYILIVAIRHPELAPRGESVSWVEKFKALRKTAGPIILVIFVLGGIYMGVVTPTEAAGLGAFVALVLGIVVYRKLNWRTLKAAIMEAIRITAMMCFIVLGGMIFSQALLIQGTPQWLTQVMIDLNLSRWTLMIALQFLFIALGTVVDCASIMLITMPVIYPLVVAMGFDPIWFGAVVVTNIETAVLTPPVGMNLFIIKGISGAPLSEIIKGSFPFVILQVITLIFVMAFPPLSLWLPSMMVRR